MFRLTNNDLFANPSCPKCNERNSLQLLTDGYRKCRSCGYTTHKISKNDKKLKTSDTGEVEK
jgi:Zn ribbon nucleic-acid-binding protein